MDIRKPKWPIYSHDDSQVCEPCAGNGFVANKNPLHPHKTCSECCGSGCVTAFAVPLAA